ncbi:MAG: hypothetical protein NC328_01600 [Muribaculum sp.]|nr:hypothetical protein [Muribaculum sp.]
MKKIFQWLISLAIIIATAMTVFPLSSCTQVDGNIGPWFGTWVVDRIDVDGAQDTSYKGEVLISFQGELFDTSEVDGPELYGKWSESDGLLHLDGSFNAGSLKTWPAPLNFGTDMKVTLKILEEPGKKMKWSMLCADGKQRDYYLRKLL